MELPVKFKQSILSLAVSAPLVLTLSACGGGGSGPSNAVLRFDSTEFQGTWNRNDQTTAGTLSNCFSFDNYGGTYGGLNRPSVITDSTITDQMEVYSDNTCSSYRGLFTRTYSVVWSPGAIAGKTHVAKALITSTGFSISADGAAGFSLSNPPASAVVSKVLFDVEGPLLYFSATGSPLDADGYPTALQKSALYTR